jgi:hypothetical protein
MRNQISPQETRESEKIVSLKDHIISGFNMIEANS